MSGPVASVEWSLWADISRVLSGVYGWTCRERRVELMGGPVSKARKQSLREEPVGTL